jgi:glucan endo-1,3-alpha-glucosidase
MTSDAFALNVGSDSWQPDRVSSAFAAAKASGTGFKLFLSFDMSFVLAFFKHLL